MQHAQREAAGGNASGKHWKEESINTHNLDPKTVFTTKMGPRYGRSVRGGSGKQPDTEKTKVTESDKTSGYLKPGTLNTRGSCKYRLASRQTRQRERGGNTQTDTLVRGRIMRDRGHGGRQ